MYIAGASPNSVKAIANIRQLCDTHLAGKYKLEVIDIYQHPKVALKEQVIAVPLLIKRSPAPLKRLIGDMSDTQKVLQGLGLIKTEY